MASLKRIWLLVFIFLLILFIGTMVYHKIEGWKYLDSLYFTTVTVTTVGYGDFAPRTDAGKIFTILFSIAGIGMVLYTLTLFTKYLINIRGRRMPSGYVKLRRR